MLGVRTSHGTTSALAGRAPTATSRLAPEKAVLKYAVGDQIKLSEANFKALSATFFAEIERKFSESSNDSRQDLSGLRMGLNDSSQRRQ